MDIISKYFSDFSPKQLQQLERLGPLYTEWNEKINVVSRKDIDSIYEKHILHSLSIAATFEFPDGYYVGDLGTGGGFPGLPLAIFFPEVKFHLVDSIAKKLKVINEIAQEIGVTNIITSHSRFEELKTAKFDVVVSRAVAPLKDLWKWSKPLLKKNATQSAANGLICLKGGDLNLEIQESGTRPRMMEVYQIFKEDYFKEKYIIQVPY